MSASTERELRTQNDDLVNAMKGIGRAITDSTLKPAQRIDRALGILSMYGCAPATTPKETP
jgi:hypothetical protein